MTARVITNQDDREEFHVLYISVRTFVGWFQDREGLGPSAYNLYHSP